MSERGGVAAPQAYCAFGFRILSDIPLPELQLWDEASVAEHELVVRLGPAPEHLPDASYADAVLEVGAGDLLLRVDPACYHVRNGREVVIEPRPDACMTDLRLYLLGSIMGAVCHQRGLLPLHANAVDFGGRAAAFAGEAGAGKSTLAAHFHRRGRPVLADDLCALSFDGGGAPRVWPGVRRLKLCGESVQALGGDPAALERVAPGLDKYSLPMAGGARSGPTPLSHVYVLRPPAAGQEPTRRLAGGEAVGALVDNVFRWRLAVLLGEAEAQFARCVDLLAHCQVLLLSRQWGLDRLAGEADRLEQALAAPDPS